MPRKRYPRKARPSSPAMIQLRAAVKQAARELRMRDAPATGNLNPGRTERVPY